MKMFQMHLLQPLVGLSLSRFSMGPVEGILGFLGVALSFALYIMRKREANAPSRQNKEIDDASQSADDIGRLNHELNDRMRRKNPDSK